MAFAMSFAKSALSGNEPLPEGNYTLQIEGFKPKVAKSGESFNLNAQLSVVGNPDYEGRKIFASLNSAAPFIIVAFVHATGMPMDIVQDEAANTDDPNYTLPGYWDGQDANPEDPSAWRYVGPLLGAQMQVELAVTEYQGKKRNEIRQYFCTVIDCTERHPTNLIK